MSYCTVSTSTAQIITFVGHDMTVINSYLVYCRSVHHTLVHNVNTTLYITKLDHVLCHTTTASNSWGTPDTIFTDAQTIVPKFQLLAGRWERQVAAGNCMKSSCMKLSHIVCHCIDGPSMIAAIRWQLYELQRYQ